MYAKRLIVPPYISDTETKLSPACAILRIERREAAWPDDVAIAPIPPSSWLIFSSTAITVGLANLE